MVSPDECRVGRRAARGRRSAATSAQRNCCALPRAEQTSASVKNATMNDERGRIDLRADDSDRVSILGKLARLAVDSGLRHSRHLRDSDVRSLIGATVVGVGVRGVAVQNVPRLAMAVEVNQFRPRQIDVVVIVLQRHVPLRPTRTSRQRKREEERLRTLASMRSTCSKNSSNNNGCVMPKTCVRAFDDDVSDSMRDE